MIALTYYTFEALRDEDGCFGRDLLWWYWGSLKPKAFEQANRILGRKT